VGKKLFTILASCSLQNEGARTCRHQPRVRNVPSDQDKNTEQRVHVRLVACMSVLVRALRNVHDFCLTPSLPSLNIDTLSPTIRGKIDVPFISDCPANIISGSTVDFYKQ